jgi:hypothetical protein
MSTLHCPLSADLFSPEVHDSVHNVPLGERQNRQSLKIAILGARVSFLSKLVKKLVLMVGRHFLADDRCLICSLSNAHGPNSSKSVRDHQVLLPKSGSEPKPNQMQLLPQSFPQKNDIDHRETCSATDLEVPFLPIIALFREKLDFVTEMRRNALSNSISWFDQLF